MSELIKITERRCAVGVQPYVKVGDVFRLIGEDKTKSGARVLIVENNKKQVASDALRINEQRFSWQPTSAAEVKEVLDCKRQKEVAQEERKDFETLKAKLTRKEQTNIAYLPLVMYSIAWHYADKCRRYAAENRLECFKKMCRTYDELRKAYIEKNSEKLDKLHMRKVEEETKKFMDEYRYDFTLFELQVRQETLTKYPDWEQHRTLLIDALCAMKIIEMVRKHNERMAEVVRVKLKRDCNKLQNKYIESLYRMADAFSGNCPAIDLKEQKIEMSARVLKNKLNEIEFHVTPI